MGDLKNTSIISPETKVPLGWVLGGFVATAAIVLFLSDMRSQAILNAANINVVDQRVKVLEDDLKTELRLIREEISMISEHRGKK